MNACAANLYRSEFPSASFQDKSDELKRHAPLPKPAKGAWVDSLLIKEYEADWFFSALDGDSLESVVDPDDLVRERGTSTQATVIVEQRPAQIAGMVCKIFH